jgi:hypothetical protein
MGSFLLYKSSDNNSTMIVFGEDLWVLLKGKAHSWQFSYPLLFYIQFQPSPGVGETQIRAVMFLTNK